MYKSDNELVEKKHHHSIISITFPGFIFLSYQDCYHLVLKSCICQEYETHSSSQLRKTSLKQNKTKLGIWISRLLTSQEQNKTKPCVSTDS